MKKLSLILGSTLVAAAAISVAAAGRHHAANVGEAAPAFEVTDTNGSPVHLSDFKGKYVVLEWSNYSCPYVQHQYATHNMQDVQKKYTAKGVEWITVFSTAADKNGYEPADKLNAMAKERGAASSSLVIDAKGSLGHLYGATNTPDMFVIDPKGNLIYSGAIDNNRTGSAELAKHSKNFVAAALDESMAGKPVTTPTSRPYGCAVHYDE